MGDTGLQGVKGGFCFTMGVTCSLMVGEVNDAGGRGKRMDIGVDLLNREEGRGPGPSRRGALK